MGFRGSGFAVATVTTQTRLGAIITKHIQWKVPVTLFAALILAGLETLFDLPCFLSHFCDQIMRAAAINQVVKSLAADGLRQLFPHFLLEARIFSQRY